MNWTSLVLAIEGVFSTNSLFFPFLYIYICIIIIVIENFDIVVCLNTLLIRIRVLQVKLTLNETIRVFTEVTYFVQHVLVNLGPFWSADRRVRARPFFILKIYGHLYTGGLNCKKS